MRYRNLLFFLLAGSSTFGQTNVKLLPMEVQYSLVVRGAVDKT